MQYSVELMYLASRTLCAIAVKAFKVEVFLTLPT